ncbi:MAG TPA: hypothetical protein VG737_15935 [Cyclobacteriaceae bacterium]|nr:hypothetical protein [Cyclobacteriaceae bacterium]
MRPKQTFFLFLLLAACYSRDVGPKTSGTEYYPLKVGVYWIYDVTETNITQLGGQTASTYQLKVEVTDSINDAGQVTYLLHRFTRPDATTPWTATTTWSARKSTFEAVLQEGNTPVVILSFPLSEGKTWNGNALNNLGGKDKCIDGTVNCDNYSVSNLGMRFEFESLFYDNTVSIIENNDADPIVGKDIRKDVYAAATGLVYREVTQLQYCTVGDCIGKQIVENGIIIKQSLKDYGAL